MNTPKPGSDKLLEDRINTWMQIVGILVAAAWGCYTFLLKEVWIPRAIPINTTLNVDIRRGEEKTIAGADKLLPLSIVVSATNPSARSVDLFHSVWLVYGYRIKPKALASFDSKKAQDALNSDPGHLKTESRYLDKSEVTLVTVGALFEDSRLQPAQKISRTQVIFVPLGQFDLLEVTVYVASAADANGLSQQWILDGLGIASRVTDKTGNTDASADTLKRHEYAEYSAHSKVTL